MTEVTNDDILPINWGDRPIMQEIRILVVPLDEIGLPFDRRGITVSIPSNSENRADFAKALGTKVEKTVKLILEENDGNG